MESTKAQLNRKLYVIMNELADVADELEEGLGLEGPAGILDEAREAVNRARLAMLEEAQRWPGTPRSG